MSIVIAGGGLAGLSAAVALTSRGLRCTLLESRPRLGGRASSFHDPASDADVDNCQHVTLGCCTNFRHFCETVGIAAFFRRETTLNFIAPDGKVIPFRAGSLPAPLHLTGAFAQLPYLTWSDKISLARGLKALARGIADDEKRIPFSEWLIRHGQSPNSMKRFWHVVLVSALSESLDRIDCGHARKVFVDSFLANREGWFVDVPTAPLEQLYGGHLTRWLTSRGSEIRLQASVEQIEFSNDQAKGARLTSGELVDGEDVVITLPFWRLKSLLPEALAAHPSLAGIDRLETSPISSVHLWFDRPITELPHAAFVDRLCQWIFNRTALARKAIPISNAQPAEASSDQKDSPDSKTMSGHYYQIVISASRELAGLSREEVLRNVLAELTAVWPETATANLIHSRQVTEHRAVFSPLPGVDELRPVQQSPVTNMQIAGDWTQTGWPATMEGAVRSGYLAAANVLKRRGLSHDVIQPDLPVAKLSRLLFGL